MRLGTHWLVDLYECKNMPTDAKVLQQTMEKAATLVGATIVCSSFHQFQPQGLSGVVIIGESHLAIHTWPEHGTACVDLFTCSETMDATPGVEFLQAAFQSQRVITRKVDRADQWTTDKANTGAQSDLNSERGDSIHEGIRNSG